MSNNAMNRRKFISVGGTASGLVGLASLTGCTAGYQGNLETVGVKNSSSTLAAVTNSNATPIDSIFNVRTYGATGDGVTDDTKKIQLAIDAAQVVGGVVFFPAGSYKTSAQLNVTSRITLMGVGYQGEDGLYYTAYGARLTQATNWHASVLVCGTDHNALVVATNDAITIEGLQITYPEAPSAGTAAIVGNAGPGTTAANTYSVIRDVVITGADCGIAITNWFDFLIENVKVFGSAKISISIAPTNYPSFGDATITNCALISPFVEAHILLQSGGGLRVINNKFNAAKIGGYGLLVMPYAGNTNPMEPLIVANNSFEAQGTAIGFLQQSTTAYINQILINNNQIWTDSAGGSEPANGISVAGKAGWCSAMVISGNVILLNAGGYCVNLTGASNVLITGNLFQCGSVGGTATAVFVGPDTENIKQAANLANGGCVYTGT